jgi:hypothetical protein
VVLVSTDLIRKSSITGGANVCRGQILVASTPSMILFRRHLPAPVRLGSGYVAFARTWGGKCLSDKIEMALSEEKASDVGVRGG